MIDLSRGLPYCGPPGKEAFIRAALTCLMALIAGCSLAPASVIYRFNGTTAGSLNEWFQYTAADYITTPGYVGTVSLDSCIRCTTNPSEQPYAIYFWPAGPHDTVDLISFADADGSAYPYYYAAGSFATDGIHHALGSNTGTLQVNDAQTPEPPAWLFAGPAIVVIWRKYRQRQA